MTVLVFLIIMSRTRRAARKVRKDGWCLDYRFNYYYYQHNFILFYENDAGSFLHLLTRMVVYVF